jgi:acyl carrier protein
MTTTDQVISILGEVLQLGDRTAALGQQTPLLGSLPELDSMAVATVIAGVEDRFGIYIEDDELSASIFNTVGTLAEFVDAKLAE